MDWQTREGPETPLHTEAGERITTEAGSALAVPISFAWDTQERA